MKTTVDVNRDLAAEAATVLGTQTLKETVNAALSEVVRLQLRRELASDIRSGRLAVPTPDEVARSGSPKVPVGALDELDAAFAPRRKRRSA